MNIFAKLAVAFGLMLFAAGSASANGDYVVLPTGNDIPIPTMRPCQVETGMEVLVTDTDGVEICVPVAQNVTVVPKGLQPGDGVLKDELKLLFLGIPLEKIDWPLPMSAKKGDKQSEVDPLDCVIFDTCSPDMVTKSVGDGVPQDTLTDADKFPIVKVKTLTFICKTSQIPDEVIPYKGILYQDQVLSDDCRIM